jgi:peptidoglycan/xylan/chitin deacetylase (PgdA/CDA1 family)
MVLWTDDPGDYASPGQRVILSRTLNTVSNGGILLLHDGIQQTVDVLPQLIESLQKRGYQFVTIDAMVAAKQTTGARADAV